MYPEKYNKVGKFISLCFLTVCIKQAKKRKISIFISIFSVRKIKRLFFKVSQIIIFSVLLRILLFLVQEMTSTLHLTLHVSAPATQAQCLSLVETTDRVIYLLALLAAATSLNR